MRIGRFVLLSLSLLLTVYAHNPVHAETAAKPKPKPASQPAAATAAAPTPTPTVSKPPLQDGQYIVATVNKKPITRFDWEQRIRVALVMADMQPTAANSEQVALPVLRNLVDEQVKLQEAERLNLSVKPEEIDNVYASIEQNNKMAKGGMKQMLKKLQVSEAAYDNEIRASLLWRKVIQRALIPEMQVSGDEVMRARQRKLAVMDRPEYRLAEIVLNSEDPSTRDRVIESAKGLMQALAAGADFYKLAKQFSSSPSAAEGGNLGLIPESLLAEDQRQLFKNQGAGRVLTLERNDEIVIYWLQEVRQPNQTYNKSIQLNVKQILLPADGDLAMAQATQQSLANTDCGQLTTQLESQVPGGRVLELSDAKLSDFSRSLAAELASMPVGGVTTPIKADSGYTMLKLCQLNLDGVAGLGTKELTDGLRQEKILQSAAQYLRTLKRSARIEIKVTSY
jgi:peptidyl-prolyl cis-trans isomerase SurA